MDPIVQQLADAYGITLSSRVCGGFDLNQPVWDGKTLSTRWLKCSYPSIDDDTLSFCEAIQMTTHDLLHEIGHYVAAQEEQRDLPEFGLGAVAFSTYHFAHLCPEVVDYDEGIIQERMVWLLCLHWGKKYNLDSHFSEKGSDHVAASWDLYQTFKFEEGSSFRRDLFWKALIRFDALRDSLKG